METKKIILGATLGVVVIAGVAYGNYIVRNDEPVMERGGMMG